MATSTDTTGDSWPAAGAARRRWLLAALFFVVGDLVTTKVGLATAAVAEVGPLAAPLIGAHGFAALIGLKLAVLAAVAVLWRHSPARYAPAFPLGLAVGGAIVTVWNAVVVGLALL